MNTMNQQETLQQMRVLNLSGMLSAYQNILNMPPQMQPPIDQLLAQLLDAEYLQRTNRKTEACIRAAHFRYQAMIEQIQYLPNRGLDKNLIARLADTDFIKRAENVFITGATGCGKSYIASALGYQGCQMGYKVAYFSMPKLLQKLQFARADGSIIKELAKLQKINLLMLDDGGDRRSDYKLLKLLPNFHYYNLLKIGMVEIQRLLHPNYPWLNGDRRSV
jgi:DNA replication protein DnaC